MDKRNKCIKGILKRTNKEPHKKGAAYAAVLHQSRTVADFKDDTGADVYVVASPMGMVYVRSSTRGTTYHAVYRGRKFEAKYVGPGHKPYNTKNAAERAGEFACRIVDAWHTDSYETYGYTPEDVQSPTWISMFRMLNESEGAQNREPVEDPQPEPATDDPVQEREPDMFNSPGMFIVQDDGGGSTCIYEADDAMSAVKQFNKRSFDACRVYRVIGQPLVRRVVWAVDKGH